MRIIRAKDYEEMSGLAADIIAEVIKEKPDCVLGLATGSTPLGVYEKLAAKYRAGELSFSRVATVNLDEYKGMGREDENSYFRFMRDNFFSKVDIRPENTHIPDGAEEEEKACRDYDRVLERVGRIDLQLLGIGHDGHIGFNEPAEAFSKTTHCVRLTEETAEANSRFFSGREEVPSYAYTMGVGSILSAKKVLMVAAGADKARILKKAAEGPVTPAVPASILQFHPDFTLVADAAALAELRG